MKADQLWEFAIGESSIKPNIIEKCSVLENIKSLLEWDLNQNFESTTS